MKCVRCESFGVWYNTGLYWPILMVVYRAIL